MRGPSIAHFVLAIAVLAMGVYPDPFAEVLHTSVNDLLSHASQTKLQAP